MSTPLRIRGDEGSERPAYTLSLIHILMVLDDLYTQDNTVEWTAVNSGSHDIEGNESSYEVKSTRCV